MEFHDLLYQGHAQAGSRNVPGGVGAVEVLEDPGELLGGVMPIPRSRTRIANRVLSSRPGSVSKTISPPPGEYLTALDRTLVRQRVIFSTSIFSSGSSSGTSSWNPDIACRAAKGGGSFNQGMRRLGENLKSFPARASIRARSRSSLMRLMSMEAWRLMVSLSFPVVYPPHRTVGSSENP